MHSIVFKWEENSCNAAKLYQKPSDTDLARFATKERMLTISSFEIQKHQQHINVCPVI